MNNTKKRLGAQGIKTIYVKIKAHIYKNRSNFHQG